MDESLWTEECCGGRGTSGLGLGPSFVVLRRFAVTRMVGRQESREPVWGFVAVAPGKTESLVVLTVLSLSACQVRGLGLRSPVPRIEWRGTPGV